MKNRNIISVIIPVHNRHDLFVKCLKSVLDQDINYPLQIIIVDEASDPPINKFIKTYFNNKDLGKITFIRNRRALGPSLARTKGLNSSRGDYIAFLDSDDFWNSDFISEAIKQLNPADSEIVTSMAKPVFVSGFGITNKIFYHILSYIRVFFFLIFYIFNNKHLPYSSLFLLRLSSMVFTRKSIGSVKFLMSYRTAEDWKFFLDCIKHNRPVITILPKLLVQVSYHYQSETIRRSHYWGYYYKLIDELPRDIKNSIAIKMFKLYTDFSVWKNNSYEYLIYKPSPKS